ncbi:MAG: PASTA domain-containing protein [Ruminococcus sp.]|nr:PASTA domain-containing protein [Ruminococcus sp.]
MSEYKMLCMGCMEPLMEGQDVCPNCGLSVTAGNLPSYLQPKTVLDSRYIVGKLIKSNGESASYIGYDNTESVKVIIKEYMPDVICQRAKGSSELIVDQNYVVQYKNYMSEFVELNKSLARLRTMSHIVAPTDMFTANNTVYAVFPHIEGITLRQYLQDNAGELTWDQVKKLFPPLLTTLACIHNAGILHRGICLDNIIVTDKNELMLTGFAIPEIRTVNTDLAPELYDGFSAPEQYSASEWEGTWTDVYAVAAVMYRLLTGCMPPEPMSRIGNDSLMEPNKINPHVPANVSKVITQAMRLSCEQRIQTITDFVTKLFDQPSYMTQLPMGATQTIPIQDNKDRRPSQSSKKKKKKKGNGGNIAMIIGAILLVGIVVAAFLALISMLLPESSDDTETTTASTTTAAPVTTAATTEATTEATEDVTTVSSDETETTTATSGTMFVMPNLVGKKYTSVADSDTWKGRLEFEVIYDYSDEYERGYIYDQDIPEGTDLYPVTTVKLYVSQGLAVVEIPDYMNEDGTRMTKEEYVALLDELNIKYECRDVETPDTLSGYVMEVYCAQTGEGVGGEINVKDGNTLYVDISVFSPSVDVFG